MAGIESNVLFPPDGPNPHAPVGGVFSDFSALCKELAKDAESRRALEESINRVTLRIEALLERFLPRAAVEDKLPHVTFAGDYDASKATVHPL